MISAKEAEVIVIQSAASVERFLEKIDPIVRRAATEGKRSAFLYVEDLWEGLDDYDMRHAEPDLIQAAVTAKLKELGYGVAFGPDRDMAPYVPRGLADDYGDGPLYQNVGLTIRW